MTTVAPIPPGSTPGSGAATTGATSVSPTEIAPPAPRPPVSDTKAAPAPSSGETDQAQGRTNEGANADAPDGDASTSSPTPDDLQLSDAEKKEFGEAINSLDPKLRKSLRRYLSNKTGEISAQKKFIEAFQQDPHGTVLKLAKHLDLDISQKPDPATQPSAAQQIEQMSQILTQNLGHEAAQAIMGLVRHTIDGTVAPIRAHHDRVLAETAHNEYQEAMADFAKAHPDWKEHEAEMVRIGKTIQVVPGSMSIRDYTETLYTLATRKRDQNRTEAEAVKEVSNRMAAAAAATESRTSGVSETRVANTPNRRLNFKEAFALAKQGKRVE